jgi:hypothetical protein
MAYTPPGVTTEVEIDSNIVQLPGGTRILSLIGLGRTTKDTFGESVFQPISRVSDTLAHSGITSINSVYDYSGAGGARVDWPTTGTGAYGGGYFLSGDQIVWSTAANQYPASTTPAVGASFYVTYTGSLAGTGMYTLVQGELVTQTSNHDVALSYSGVTIVSVTGTSGYVYPASGTVSGVDSLGFGRDNSGYVLSPSGTLLWGAVPSTAYGYSYATVPALSGTYFVDYTYAKSGSDYAPKNFVDYSLVVQEYGPEAEWTLIASGAGQGNYVLNHLNPLTLGARLAFANGASVVNLTQMSGVGTTTGDFQASLNQLQGSTVDIIVPLTVGSGASLNEITTSEKSLILQAVLLHCETMSSPQNKKERVSVGSLGVANVGDNDTVDTYVFEAQNSLHDKRSTLIAPGKCTVQIQDPNGRFQNIVVDSAFLATAFGALSCNPLSDVATPLTRQRLSNFVNISAATTEHPNDTYLEIEKDILGGAGVCVIDKLGSNIFVRHQLTTDQSNPAVGEFSVVTLTDFVSQAVRYTTEQYIGKKLIPAIVVPAVKSTILATMQQLAQDNIISSIGAITVTVNPSNPTEILSTVQYVPVFPLNRIKVTFTIRTQL